MLGPRKSEVRLLSNLKCPGTVVSPQIPNSHEPACPGIAPACEAVRLRIRYCITGVVILKGQAEAKPPRSIDVKRKCSTPAPCRCEYKRRKHSQRQRAGHVRGGREEHTRVRSTRPRPGDGNTRTSTRSGAGDMPRDMRYVAGVETPRRVLRASCRLHAS